MATRKIATYENGSRAAVVYRDADWQELLSHPGRRKLQGGRVVATEPPAPSPEAQAAADRALLREPCSENSSRSGSSSAPQRPKASRPRRSPRSSACAHAGWQTGRTLYLWAPTPELRRLEGQALYEHPASVRTQHLACV
jgi:hypothetical protein